ncbi:MAG: DUF748 domain-containing protein [Verrucomicrobiota bacterium]
MSKPNDPQSKPLNPLIEARRKRAQPKPRRGRGWMIAGGVFVFLILFGFFGLPPIVRSQAIKLLSAELNGRAVTIEKVRLNPLVLSASVEGFAITNPDGTPFLSWSRVYANFDSFSLFTGQWRFQAVEIDDFAANISRDQAARFNFQDLLDQAAEQSAAAEPAPEPAGDPRPLYVGRVVVSGAKIDFADHSLAHPFATAVGPISFELNRFNTAGDAKAPYSFDAVTESGERFAWQGTVSLDPVKSQGELDLAGIRLGKYSPYHAALHNADLRSGVLNVSGRYAVDLSGAQPRAVLENGAVTLRDFSLAVRGEIEPLLNLKQLALTGIAADLAANTARVERVALDGGHARLHRAADGTLNVLDLLPEPAADPVGASLAKPDPVASPSAFELPDFTLGELAVTGFSVDVEDLATPRPAKLAIQSIDFTLADFALRHLDRRLPLGLTVTFATGGTVALNGEAALEPLSAAAQLAVADFAVTPFSPYLEPAVNIRLADGRARTAGSVLLENNTLTYTGDAGLDQLVVLDPVQAEKFVSWTSLALNGLRFISEPLALHLDEIVITDPAANVLVAADGTLNLAAALSPAPSATVGASLAKPESVAPPSPSTSEPAAVLPDITIGKVTLRSAKLGYEDRSVQPAARTAITLDGDITGLSSAQLARADVNLAGKVDDSAPIAITGQLNPLGQPAYSKLTVDFTDIDLPAALGPYLGKYAGYELARGSLTLDVDFNLADRRIAADNVITLDQFTLGARTDSPDATKLPVSLAIALLKDSSGQIVLDVPIKGSLDDPKFKIGRVVLRVITNVLVKAATSPFSLLGAAFGGGGDELAYQLLQPGAVEPVEAELKKLETVAKALLARPALQLDIQGSYAADADRAALQRARLDEQLRHRLWEQLRATTPDLPPPDQLGVTPEQNAALLIQLYNETFPPAEGTVAPVISTAEGAVITAPVAQSAESAAAADSARAGGRRFGPRGSFNFGGSTSSDPSAGSAPPSNVILPVPAGTPGAPSEFMTADGIPVLTPEQAAGKLAVAIEVTDDDLRALADQRAQAVRTWLTTTGQVPADRVYLIATGTKGARVDFNLR